ncbi:MAG: hypothetical protein LBQ09_00650 [Acidobacteriaceae bacterium]|nr:hypothetical protein [Acidobacteriaceae bacterium]
MIAALSAAQQPAPQPFPRPATPGTQQTPPSSQPGTPPTAPAAQPLTPSAPAATTADGQPSESMLGVPIYPGAQFLVSYDAGRGQRFYLFGTTASFVDLVTFYRNALKQRGDLVFDAPATHQFDVGKFREDTMAFPPGVTIKDFQSQISQGYPNPKLGGQPARFPTVIQIVPVPDR